MVRLTAEFWVQAYLARLRQADIPAYVMARGDATAGAVLVKCSTLDGLAVAFQRRSDPMSGESRWMELAQGPEAEVDGAISRQRGFDPDLWVIEIEDRAGRHLLGEDGLAYAGQRSAKRPIKIIKTPPSKNSTSNPARFVATAIGAMTHRSIKG